LIKTEEQFLKEGCNNCAFLEIKEDVERLQDCTSANFVGLISMMAPTDSWVARWNHLVHFVPGCYCIDVVGEFPEHVQSILEDNGIRN